jgi:hypothetical protein
MRFVVLLWLQYINIGLLMKLVYYAIWCAVVATVYQYWATSEISVLCDLVCCGGCNISILGYSKISVLSI